MAKQKYYVVWKGRKPGVYNSWDECKEQIFQFPKAEYKSFPSKEMAEKAFHERSAEFLGKNVFGFKLSEEELLRIGEPIYESICVDGAWDTSTGIIEYRGVYTKSGDEIFRVGPYEDGTNNVAEFLAIVHALAYCKQKGLTVPIYSDSRNAIRWVKDKDVRTRLEQTGKNKKLFELIGRAVKWLKENQYDNEVLKWETKAWGENPADFGRK